MPRAEHCDVGHLVSDEKRCVSGQRDSVSGCRQLFSDVVSKRKNDST